MDTDLLLYFMAVADYRSITRAAESLYISQPTLSRKIFLLEEEFEVKLFTRQLRSVELTPAGVILYNESFHLIDSLSLLRDKLRRTQTAEYEPLRIIMEPLNNETFKAFLLNYKKKNPDTSINIMVTGPQKRLSELQMHSADVVFARLVDDELSLLRENYEIYRIYRTKMCAVCHKDHPLAKNESLCIEQLHGETLYYLRHLKENMFQMIEKLIKLGGMQVAPLLPGNMEDTFFQLSINGGFTFTEANSAPMLAQVNNCVVLDIEDVDTSFDIVTYINKGDTNPAIEALLIVLEKSFPGFARLA